MTQLTRRKTEHFAIYDVETGAILRVGKSTNPKVIGLEKTRLTSEQRLYRGLIDPATTYLPGGIPTPKPLSPVVVTPSEVKAFAGRILSYTDWVDIRSINGAPADPAMVAYRQAVRDRSGEIEAMEPIPADYRDPKWWPQQP